MGGLGGVGGGGGICARMTCSSDALRVAVLGISLGFVAPETLLQS